MIILTCLTYERPESNLRACMREFSNEEVAICRIKVSIVLPAAHTISREATYVPVGQISLMKKGHSVESRYHHACPTHNEPES